MKYISLALITCISLAACERHETKANDYKFSAYGVSLQSELTAMLDGKPRNERQLLSTGASKSQLKSLVQAGVLTKAGKHYYHKAAPRKHYAHKLERPSIFSVGDAGDVLTTAVALNSDTASELNPLLNWADNSTIPFIAMGSKIGLRYYMHNHTAKDSVSINLTLNTVGYFATCNNLAVILSGATVGASLAAGAVCGLAYRYYAVNEYNSNFTSYN